MRVHITNLYGQDAASVAMKAQNRAARAAKENLNYNELGIFFYKVDSDSPEMLSSRLDGIIASVAFGDIVIFQFPTWNAFEFDEALLGRLSLYRRLKKITFVHDMRSLMFESNRYLLSREIGFMNQTDLVILPSQKMADFLRAEGLTVEKIVIQRMWDFPVAVDQFFRPPFGRVVNFAGNPDMEKFQFAKEWKYDAVELRVTAERGDWAQGKNIGFLGWFSDDVFLANALRHSGGFGLVWSEEPYFSEYMKMNASYKLSAYLAAGIPVIVKSTIAEKETIIRKNLGLVVDSLDEAVERIAVMRREDYDKMVDAVSVFSNLIRENYFVKKALTDAVFKVLYD